MNLLNFNNRFPDEQSCRSYLRQKRENEGITCKRCKGTKHYWLENKQLWKCADCSSWTNLRAGTIMEKSKVPVKNWFMCIHLMTSTKKAFSALEMQRQLGMKRYEPVWLMMQKVRLSMGKRDSRYQLKGEIEMDDAFFEIVDIKEEGNESDTSGKSDELKRGRGSQRQAKVLVMVESKANPVQNNPHKKKRIMGFVKMVVMDDLNQEGIGYEVEKGVGKESHILTDGYRGYAKLEKKVAKHTQMTVPAKEAHKKLPWVHTVISNAKKLFLGIHHSVNKKYLQNYLNEFCYKLNRRTFESDLFDRMIIAGANDTWY